MGVAYDPARAETFVVNDLSGSVSVISDSSNTVTATVHLPEYVWGPNYIAFDSRIDVLYVTDWDSPNLTEITDHAGSFGGGPTVPANSVVEVIPLLPPGESLTEGVAYDSGKGEVFVANMDWGNVWVVSDTTDQVTTNITLPYNDEPWGLAYDSAKGEMFVTDNATDQVSVLSDSTNQPVATVGVAGGPQAAAYDSGKHEVFVANTLANSVSIISDATNALVANVHVGSQPEAIAYDPAGNVVFVANYGSNNVSVISDALDRVVATVAVGSGPDGVAYDTEKGEAYVANSGSDTVSVLTTVYPVTFTQSTGSALPSGTLWFVNVSGGLSYASTTGSLSFTEPNGSYTYTVATTNKEYSAPGGSFTVSGSPVAVTLSFGLVTYAVTLSQTGLPSGIEWFVNVTSGGGSFSSTTSTISFAKPNGSYTYSVATTDKKYVALGGSFTVDGSSVSLRVWFSAWLTDVRFQESGLPLGTLWYTDLNGTLGSTYGSGILFLVPNGTCAYTIDPVAGYTVSPASGSLTITGSGPVTVPITFTQMVYPVRFTESGLPAGATWFVNLTYTAAAVTGVTRTVPTGGSAPAGEAYDPARGELFVANYASDNVSVINVTNDTVVANVSVGSYPMAAVYDAGRGEVFVANYGSSNVSVINDATDTVVASVPVPLGPCSLAYDPAQGEVFVAGCNGEFVNIIADASNTVVAAVLVGSQPVGLAYDSQDGEVFVANEGSGNVSVVSVATNTVVAWVQTDCYPDSLAYDPQADEVFAACQGSGGIDVISGPLNAVVNGLLLPTYSDAIAYDPSTGYLFVTSSEWNLVSVVSAATLVLEENVWAGGDPDGLACDPALGVVFVANAGAESVSVLYTAPVTGYAWFTASTRTMSFTEPNGTYDYTVSSANPMFAPPSGGAFTVAGAAVSEPAPFVEQFPVTLTESGLPAGTSWFVNVSGGPSYRSTTTTVGITDPNGTYNFSVGSANKSYRAPAGSFTVAGNPLSETVPFSLVTFPVTFTETGLPSPVLVKYGWNVVVGGALTAEHGATATFELPNGTESYLISGPSGYWVTGGSPSGTVRVAGQPVAETFGFAKGTTVALTFAEKGLGKGQAWCVELGSEKVCSTTAGLKLSNLTPASYAFSVVSPLSGQNITGVIGTSIVTLTGGVPATWDLTSNAKVVLTFAYRYAVTFTPSGLTTGTWSLTIKGLTKTAAYGSSIVFNETNGTWGYKVGAISGFTSVGSPKKAVVSGAGVKVSVVFTAKKGKSVAVDLLAGAFSCALAAVAAPGQRHRRPRPR